MAKKINIFLLLILAALAVACGKSEEEMVPLDDRTSSTKTYKMPNPTLLNSQESAIVDSIRAEYRKNAN